MLRPVSDLFRRTEQVSLDELDIKHFIERYLRERLGSLAIYCERVREGQAVVRVPSPLLQQEVYLMEYDLALVLQREAHYTLRSITAIQS